MIRFRRTSALELATNASPNRLNGSNKVPRPRSTTPRRWKACSSKFVVFCVLLIVALSHTIYYNSRHRLFKFRFPIFEMKLLRFSDVYADPPTKYFEPLPEDTAGLPNVVYGCGNTTRQVVEIQIHVIGWRRREHLANLLYQLHDANYSGWSRNVPLFIHIDGEPDPETLAVARNFQWSHGPTTVSLQPKNVGLRKMWIDSIGSAARKAGNDTLLVVFEDDIIVSHAYFQWLLATIDMYARNPQCRDSNLVGFSLSPIIFQEMQKPFRKWEAQEVLGKRCSGDHRHIAYLSSIPSSWGAAYWSDHWKNFDDFVAIRMRPEFYFADEESAKVADYGQFNLTPAHLRIPNARSNVWPKSWKRFMVDFMYARGLVMLYPNLRDKRGLATPLQISGEHVPGKSRGFQNPRKAELVDHLDLQAEGNLPIYGDLGVIGLDHTLTTREQLAARGAEFLNAVWEQCANCDELLTSWSRPSWNIPSKGIQDIPKICAADLYTPISLASSHEVPCHERFLLFEPQYGVNNQLEAAIEAYFWAKALGRRLVLPPILVPRASAHKHLDRTSQLKFSDFFKVLDADWENFFGPNFMRFEGLHLKPIEFDEFVKLKARPWRLVRATREAMFDSSTRLQVSALDSGNISLINLRHLFNKPVSVERVQHLMGGCQDQVLAFDGMFFANLIGLDRRKLLPDFLILSDPVRKLYDSIKSLFLNEIGQQNYACYHVRLGDFVEMCDTLENVDPDSEIAKIYFKTLRKYHCVVTPEDLVVSVQKNGMPAFIMSDKADKLKDALEKLEIRTVTSDWVETTIKSSLGRSASKNEMELLSLVIDQELCSEAKLAVLNRFSTVSQRVLNLRREYNYEYWTRSEPLS